MIIEIHSHQNPLVRNSPSNNPKHILRMHLIPLSPSTVRFLVDQSRPVIPLVEGQGYQPPRSTSLLTPRTDAARRNIGHVLLAASPRVV